MPMDPDALTKAAQAGVHDGDAPAALSVRALSVHIPIPGGRVLRAVDGISFTLRRGETLGLVGESGSGKTMTAMAIMRLLEGPLANAVRGQVLLDGVELLGLAESAMSDVRGAALGMVFQEPMTSLNPVMRIGRQIQEPLRRHLGLSAAEASARAQEMLALVKIPDPRRAMALYPYELSGGMRQRVMIAIALACRPAMLIADEPTTALDVTVQAQILELIQKLRQDFGSAVALITHDMGVVAEVTDRVAVMYAGRIIEQGTKRDVFTRPQHPYTWGLLGSIPPLAGERPKRLPSIPGAPPSLLSLPPGCAFAPRCRYRFEPCDQRPPLVLREGRGAACFLPPDSAPVLRHRDNPAAA